MTSRREKESSKDGGVAGPPQLKSGGGAATVPGHVVAKLLLFTLAMVAAPLGSYFLSVNYVFVGNNTIAGATAAVVANVVLISYVIVAINEADEGGRTEKKTQ